MCTHVLVSVHAGEVQRRVAIIVLSVCVGLVVQEQELEDGRTAQSLLKCMFFSIIRFIHRDSLVSPLAGQVQRRQGVVVRGVHWCPFVHQHVDQLGLT